MGGSAAVQAVHEQLRWHVHDQLQACMMPLRSLKLPCAWHCSCLPRVMHGPCQALQHQHGNVQAGAVSCCSVPSLTPAGCHARSQAEFKSAKA